MDSVAPLQIGHLVLEGAVIALCAELVLRSLFVPPSQKSWRIRILKIIMATAMLTKSAIFSAFSSSSLQDHCIVAGRIADVFYHTASIAGNYILLLRVEVIISYQYQQHIRIFHAVILIARFGLAIADIILVRIRTDPVTRTCQYTDKHEIGVAYTLYDSSVDVYVSLMVTFILCMHIRRLRQAHLVGSNLSLYVSVVLSNVIRTVILSILNIVCTLYYISRNDDPTTFLIIWPINNMFFIILIGYDTNIAKSIRKFRSQAFADINKKKVEASPSRQQENSSRILHDTEQQNDSVPIEPLTPNSTRLTRDSSRLRRPSSVTSLDMNDDQGFTTKLSGIESEV